MRADILSRAPLILFFSSLAGLIAIVFQVGSANVRFESDMFNYAFALWIMLLLPASILWGASRMLSGKARWIVPAVLGGVFSLALFFPVSFVVGSLSDIAETGHDSSYEKINEQVINGNLYRLYRTSEGAAARYGFALRAESNPFLGLKAVRTIKYVYPASDARLEVLPSGMARLIIEPYSAGGAVENFEFQP